MIHILSTSAATSVTIGLQETSYSVYETDEYQVVCAEVLSGDIAGRSININYITESDTAEGIYPTDCFKFHCIPRRLYSYQTTLPPQDCM